MARLLELGGLGLVAVMALGFVGALRPAVEPGLSPVFWGCAGGALLVIMYRKWSRGRPRGPSGESTDL